MKFFFLISLCKGTWIYSLVFSCHDPTYNPSPSAFYFVMWIEYLSLSLGVVALHITPDTSLYIVKMVGTPLVVVYSHCLACSQL